MRAQRKLQHYLTVNITPLVTRTLKTADWSRCHVTGGKIITCENLTTHSVREEKFGGLNQIT